MRRRAFLGALVVFLGGCAESLPTDGLPTATPSETQTAPPTATATATESPTPTERPTQSPTAVETPTPTPTPTDTPTPQRTELSLSAQLAADRISEGRERIAEAVEAYAEFARTDTPTILDVTAATTRYRFAAINGHISNASNALLDARDKGNSQQQAVIDRLLDVVEFLRLAGQTQERVVACFSAFTEAKTALEEENVDRTRNRLDAMANQRRFGRNRLEELRSNTEEENMGESTALGRQQYREKVAQFDLELATVNALLEPLSRFADGIQRLADARRLERQENHNNAERAAREAEDIFEDVVAALDSVLDDEVAPAFEVLLEELRALAEEKRVEADDF